MKCSSGAQTEAQARELRKAKDFAENQSLQLTNSLRSMRQALIKTRDELKQVKGELAKSLAEGKELRQLVSSDQSAVSSYLGIVLGKKTDDLAPAEKKQVRTLLKDNGDGQAKSTMAAWDTILDLKQQLERERGLLGQIYKELAADECAC